MQQQQYAHARPRREPPPSEEDVLAAVQEILAHAHRAGRRARLFAYGLQQVPVGMHFVPELTLTVRLEIEPRPRALRPAVTIAEEAGA